MKKNRINTTSVREIKHSFKRFLSLLIMSILGVGVFVGIKMAAPDMMKSVDSYYDQSNLYDIKIISTLGLTDDDIKNITKVKGIKEAYGSYSKDVLLKTSDEELAIKVIGVTNDVNKVEIIKGRFPEKISDIVVEESLLERENLKIGDKIELKDEDTFRENKLTIVGVVKSPLYIGVNSSSTKRDNTSIGSGKINYYTYVNEDNFKLDYYTEIYLTVEKAKEKTTNSKDYNKLVEEALENVNKIKSSSEKRRYNEIYNKINDEIVKNESEANEKFNSAKKALDNSKFILNDAKSKLDDANKELTNTSLKLHENKEKLNNAKQELNDFKNKLDSSKIQIEKAKQEISNKLSNSNLTYDDIKNVYNTINDIDKEDLIKLIPEDTPNYEEIISMINGVDVDNYKEFLKEFLRNPENIDKLIDIIPSDTPYYDDVIKTLETYKQNSDKLFEVMETLESLIKAEEEYNKNLELYNSSLEEYNKNNDIYINYYNEYQNGVSIYNNSLRTYSNNLNLYNTKIEEYYNSKKIFDLETIEARKKLDEIPSPVWYTYTRLDDNGYSSFIDDGKSVSNLSKIFPTIFFVVAVLISLISMSRMVEDDRMVIGTLKSLGFNNRHIRKKYLLYSGIATITGGIIGSIIGFFLLPIFIWNIYKILFEVPVFKYDFNPTNIIIGVLIAVICICGTTIFTIRKVVKEKPSDLMRPKAPENGKRVILEKITFIWSRIKFSNKITIRNLFRYKKRVLMTIVGILGCTALMLAGFGIRDSVASVPSKQFGEVFHFDEMVYLTGDLTKEEIDEIFDNKHIVNRLDTNMIVSMTSNKYDINVFIPDNENDLKNVLSLEDINSEKTLSLKDNEVIITGKLSELIKKNVKDKVSLTDSNNNKYDLTISSISKNYVGNYVFMNKRTYEDNIGTYKTNVVYINLDDIKNEEALSKSLLENENVMSVTSINSSLDTINDMLKSLNSIVFILIILSGALSFVVLYNLSYINISERKREIATLKVLGFTDKEVDKYITKETVILTLIGISLGLIFGIFLTNVIVNTVEIEQVRFIHNIKSYSFIITALIVMLFTLIVNKIIHYSLKKIDMIESLKSVE